MNRTFATLALASLSLPVMAVEAIEKGDKLVIVPWGDWLVAIADGLVQLMLPILLPLVAGTIIAAIRKTYPMAALLLTQARVELMVQNAADYGVNAVRGAAKGKKLSIQVGSEVIRAGTQYVVDTAPAAAVAAAGGADGIAQKIFRKLELDDDANVENTLIPSSEWLGHNVPAAKAKGR